LSFTIHRRPGATLFPYTTLFRSTEDTAVDGSGNLTASGAIPISDADQGQSAFQTAVTGAAGNLGSLSLAADGSYTYAVANAAVRSEEDTYELQERRELISRHRLK